MFTGGAAAERKISSDSLGLNRPSTADRYAFTSAEGPDVVQVLAAHAALPPLLEGLFLEDSLTLCPPPYEENWAVPNASHNGEGKTKLWRITGVTHRAPPGAAPLPQRRRTIDNQLTISQRGQVLPSKLSSVREVYGAQRDVQRKQNTAGGA
ncbi:hypothetical protein EYF80_055666 [Liparis tanakae]|uniref:Uncharacterized protein n=1 Tax=Liparis tanakae TaxID=230148 RepID=A0A4Z2F070_9TELE|nr:hypothetical protein EYF80_055666 [Liparis tanakae]